MGWDVGLAVTHRDSKIFLMSGDSEENAENSSSGEEAASSGNKADFVPTRWSMVIRAGDLENPDESRRALTFLCEAYWYPLYAFLRRNGESVQDAQDLAQGFFADLLLKDTFSKVETDGGLFRSFLLRALKNYRTSQWRRENARKRGGGSEQFSLDAEEAEQRYLVEAAGDDLPPEVLFDRRWAKAVLEQVFSRLRDDYRRSGKLERYETLKAYLLSNPESGGYRKCAEALQMSESGVRTLVERMRAQFGHFLRLEVGETVADPSQVDEEMAHLRRILSGK